MISLHILHKLHDYITYIAWTHYIHCIAHIALQSQSNFRILRRNKVYDQNEPKDMMKKMLKMVQCLSGYKFSVLSTIIVERNMLNLWFSHEPEVAGACSVYVRWLRLFSGLLFVWSIVCAWPIVKTYTLDSVQMLQYLLCLSMTDELFGRLSMF